MAIRWCNDDCQLYTDARSVPLGIEAALGDRRAGYAALQVENLTLVRNTNPEVLIDHEAVIADEEIILRNYTRIKFLRNRMDVVGSEIPEDLGQYQKASVAPSQSNATAIAERGLAPPSQLPNTTPVLFRH